jgi:hypothetical protein
MSDDRLDECRERLDLLQAGGGTPGDEVSLEARADALEFVHRSLVAELDDLLDGDHRA